MFMMFFKVKFQHHGLWAFTIKLILFLYSQKNWDAQIAPKCRKLRYPCTKITLLHKFCLPRLLCRLCHSSQSSFPNLPLTSLYVLLLEIAPPWTETSVTNDRLICKMYHWGFPPPMGFLNPANRCKKWRKMQKSDAKRCKKQCKWHCWYRHDYAMLATLGSILAMNQKASRRPFWSF